jgi:hypothetical protein
MAAIVLLAPRIGALSWKTFEAKLSWGLILTVGASMSLARSMIDSAAAAWLGNLFVTQLTALTVAPPVVVVLIVVAVALVHLAITNLAACMALLIPIAVTIAEAAHLNPLVCGLVVTIAVDAIILYPVQTAANLLAYEAGYFHTADVRRLGVGMLVLTIVVALLVLPYWGLLALPELVAHHPHFEEQRRRIDAPADLFEVRRADARRAVHDFEEAALELVEHAGDRALAGVERVLTVETAGVEQVAGPALLGRDVAARRVHDVGEHALGAIEMVGDRREQDLVCGMLAVVTVRGGRTVVGVRGVRGDRRDRRRSPLPGAAADERPEHQDRCGRSKPDPRERRERPEPREP